MPGSANNYLSIHAKGEINAGSFFTQASSGFLMKLGAFEKAGQSAYFDAGLYAQPSTQRRNHELFFYFEPTVTYQFFNATVQGGMFTHEKDEYTTVIQPYYYSHKFGVMYVQRGCYFQLGFTYKTREAHTMKTNENFGTIALGFKF